VTKLNEEYTMKKSSEDPLKNPALSDSLTELIRQGARPTDNGSNRN
jgi:hypothetical protein